MKQTRRSALKLAIVLLAGFVCILKSDTDDAFSGESVPGPPPALPDPSSPPEALPDEEEVPYWSETVETALANAASDNPEVRRSAVMLLGKYPVPRAEAAVVRALEDEDAGVREAALVSLFETRRMYRGRTAVKIVERVADPDVGIRRLATNVLPMVVQGFPLTMSPRDRRPVRDFPGKLESILMNAFRDEDVTVRRNMISHFRQLFLSMPEDLMADLLRDEDSQVAIEALEVAADFFDPEFLARQAPGLASHPDRLFRLNLVRHIGEIDPPGARKALEILREDEDPGIALAAWVGLFRRDPRPETYEALMRRIEEEPGHREIARRAIQAARLLGEEAVPYLEEWMEHSDPDLRYEATRNYFLHFSESVDEERILRVLSEESRSLRGLALRFLRRHPRRVTPEIVRTAAESRRADARLAAVELSRFIGRESGAAIVRELLLDGDKDVRALALREMASRRMEGWEKILGLSLQDSDKSIREVALRELFRQVSPGTFRELKSFLEREPESPMRPAIERHLARHGTPLAEEDPPLRNNGSRSKE